MNSGESLGLVSEAGRASVEFVSISWCFVSPGRARVSRGVRRLGHSSSELLGVLGTSALKQVDDVLVREGQESTIGTETDVAWHADREEYCMLLTSTAIRNLSTASTAQRPYW